MTTKTTIKIQFCGGEEKEISLQDILKMAGMQGKSEDDIYSVQTILRIEETGTELKSSANRSDHFPGITVDGAFKGKDFYLANVELPNSDYPDDFVSRLYAGCADYESDAPIAMAKSNIYGEGPDFKSFSEFEKHTKIVYIDEDYAMAQTWTCAPFLREHAED